MRAREAGVRDPGYTCARSLADFVASVNLQFWLCVQRAYPVPTSMALHLLLAYTH